MTVSQLSYYIVIKHDLTEYEINGLYTRASDLSTEYEINKQWSIYTTDCFRCKYKQQSMQKHLMMWLLFKLSRYAQIIIICIHIYMYHDVWWLYICTLINRIQQSILLLPTNSVDTVYIYLVINSRRMPCLKSEFRKLHWISISLITRTHCIEFIFIYDNFLLPSGLT